MTASQTPNSRPGHAAAVAATEPTADARMVRELREARAALRGIEPLRQALDAAQIERDTALLQRDTALRDLATRCEMLSALQQRCATMSAERDALVRDRDQLRAALRATLPYARSRVEDMEACADEIELADIGSVDGEVRRLWREAAVAVANACALIAE